MVLCIAPLGGIEREILDALVKVVEAEIGIRCQVLPPLENPKYAYNEKRSQYDSKTILERIKACCPHNALGILGVTHVDLCLPVLKYLFGLSELGGKSGLISLHRLRSEFYNEPEDRGKLLERVEKTALHELGHILGLTHCRDPRCVMSSSTTVDHTDAKGLAFCPTCRELLAWECKKRGTSGKASKV